MHRIQAVFLLIAACLAASSAGTTSQPRPWAGDRFDVMEKRIPELQGAMRRGAITARDLVEIYLARIDACDRRGPRINAMVVLNPRALEEAGAFDAERSARGPRGPLHGIPVVVKDNFDMAGLPTSAGTYLATVPDAPVKSLADILERGLYHRAVETSLRRRSAAAGRTRVPRGWTPLGRAVYDAERDGGSQGGAATRVGRDRPNAPIRRPPGRARRSSVPRGRCTSARRRSGSRG